MCSRHDTLLLDTLVTPCDFTYRSCCIDTSRVWTSPSTRTLPPSPARTTSSALSSPWWRRRGDTRSLRWTSATARWQSTAW